MPTDYPKYKCYKEVHAVKIKSIELDSEEARKEGRETDGSGYIVPQEGGYEKIKINNDYIRKHNPQIGGYYVIYKDGYTSFSPAEAFESGYELIK